VGFSSLPKRLFSKVRKIDVNHEKIATQAENVSMTTGVVAGIAAAGAAIAAPTDFPPLSSTRNYKPSINSNCRTYSRSSRDSCWNDFRGTYFYSKWKNNRKKANKSEEQSHD